MLSLIGLLNQYQSGRKSDLFHMNNIKKKASSYFKRILKDSYSNLFNFEVTTHLDDSNCQLFENLDY